MEFELSFHHFLLATQNNVALNPCEVISISRPAKPDLPKEVLQHIYSVKDRSRTEYYCYERVLSLKDRVGDWMPFHYELTLPCPEASLLCQPYQEMDARLTSLYPLQVRALAVCRAWKDHLDPKQWPVIGYDLDGSQEAHHRIASWICATQPALRALSMANFDQPQLLVTLASVGARTVRGFCHWPLEGGSGRRSVNAPTRRA